MTRARIAEDLQRIVVAAGELLAEAVSYEKCLDDFVTDLIAANDDDTSGLWSLDDVHLRPADLISPSQRRPASGSLGSRGDRNTSP
ncbi:MAG: hypothetical protein M3Y17_05300 [Actinomycetota bacterium]|nr:hypothetical protein [Actinomycetota bacterium]